MHAAVELLQRAVKVLQVLLLLVDGSGIDVRSRLRAHGIALRGGAQRRADLGDGIVQRVDQAVYQVRVVLRRFGGEGRRDLHVQPQLQPGFQALPRRLR